MGASIGQVADSCEHGDIPLFDFQLDVQILCIKLEIKQGYTTMHGQPIIKKR